MRNPEPNSKQKVGAPISALARSTSVERLQRPPCSAAAQPRSPQPGPASSTAAPPRRRTGGRAPASPPRNGRSPHTASRTPSAAGPASPAHLCQSEPGCTLPETVFPLERGLRERGSWYKKTDSWTDKRACSLAATKNTKMRFFSHRRDYKLEKNVSSVNSSQIGKCAFLYKIMCQINPQK